MLAAIWWAVGIRPRLRRHEAGPDYAREHPASQHND